MLIRLINLPRRIQFYVASIVAIVAALVPVCLTLAVLFALKEQSTQIEELRVRAGKLVAIAAMKEQATRIAAAPLSPATSALLIDAENLPIAKANLQSRVSAIAAAHNASVSSSGSVPDVVENGLLLIGLRADISGTNEAVEGFLGEIESSKPLLLVREFLLRSQGAPTLDAAPILTASIRLYGATRRNGDTPTSAKGKIAPAPVQP
jgi:Type II secretion system (T2SS), protein M subtype b